MADGSGFTVRVDDLGDECHRRNRARVTTGLGALGNYKIAAAFYRSDCVSHLAAH